MSIDACPESSVVRASAPSRSVLTRASCASSSGPRTGVRSGWSVEIRVVAMRLFWLLGDLSVEASGELLDPALRLGQLAGAASVELLAPLPEDGQLLELDLAALEPLDDLLELSLALLEGRLCHLDSAPNEPPATSIVSSIPAGGGSRTSASALRTIA